MKKILMFFLVLVTAVLSMVPLGAVSEGDYIKYAEFNVTYEALCEALEQDISTYNEDVHINWVELLSLLGAKYGGDFSHYKTKDLRAYAQKIQDGQSLRELSKDMKYFDYYHQVYNAVLQGFVGEHTRVSIAETGEITEETVYGLKVCSPIAATFPYSHFDDFGASRSYGYDRRHLGHDMMAAVGTPVIAVESGEVEVLGWNQYGGWRIGIRSEDGMRYYYYAHLRQNRPYHCDLKEGEKVAAGDVIGYVGRTGYSPNENENGIETPHLHWGLELVFDESQKESDNEIWIDLYAITKLLETHRSQVVRVAETKEFYSLSQQRESQ